MEVSLLTESHGYCIDRVLVCWKEDSQDGTYQVTGYLCLEEHAGQ